MHFTVAVLSKSIEGYCELLAPYQENNMGTCPMEYMEFEDVEEEYLEEYKNESIKKVVMPDGRLLDRYDKEVRNIDDSKLNIKNIPASEIYPTFKEYMEKHVGFYEKDKRTGKYGYWYNPRAKWDWYLLGGRWRGMLLVRDDAPSLVGTPGVFGDNLETREAPKGYKWVDVAKIKDIEWKKMKGLSKENAIKDWEKVMNMDEKDKGIESFLYGIRGNDTKESYVERLSNFGTFAVLTNNGEWYEQEYGFEEEWEKEFFDKFIKSANPELFLAIVDCHI